MQVTSPKSQISTADSEYRRLMIRELLIWLFAVPLTLVGVIGYIVL